jgi:hypothetical protein
VQWEGCNISIQGHCPSHPAANDGKLYIYIHMYIDVYVYIYIFFSLFFGC